MKQASKHLAHRKRVLSDKEIEQIKSDRKIMKAQDVAQKHLITYARVKEICGDIKMRVEKFEFTDEQKAQIINDKRTMTYKQMFFKWGASKSTLLPICGQAATLDKMPLRVSRYNIPDEVKQDIYDRRRAGESASIIAESHNTTTNAVFAAYASVRDKLNKHHQICLTTAMTIGLAINTMKHER